MFKLLGRAIREARRRVEFALDPIGYHRARGARIGLNVELIAGHIHSLGSEPYLVTIGDDVTISNDVQILTHDGGLRVIRDKHPGAFLYRPVAIHSGAFIGARATILPGVTIGRRAVVGAGAVVVDDVPDETVVAGVPARPKKSVAEYALAHQDEWINTAGMSEEEKRAAIMRYHGPNARDAMLA